MHKLKLIKALTYRRPIFSIDNSVEKADSLFKHISTIIVQLAGILILLLAAVKINQFFYGYNIGIGFLIAFDLFMLALAIIAYAIWRAREATALYDAIQQSLDEKPCGHPIDALRNEGDELRCQKCGKIVDLKKL